MKTDRMFKCLLLMLGGKKLSSAEIAEELEVSRRSVQRYMEALANAGFPVIATSGVNGGYSLSENFPYNGALFTAEEYSEIRDCILSGGIPEDEKKRCIRKLKGIARDEDEQPTLFAHKEDDCVMQTVKKALELKCCVRIEYIDREEEASTRVIEPHCRFYREGVWYIYAYCRERSGFRTFKIGRIREAFLLEEQRFLLRAYTLKTDLSLLPRKDEEFVDVTFFADESIYDDLATEFGGDKLTPCGRGYLVRIYEPNDKTLIRQLLGFGANITVVYPQSIRLELKKAAEKIIEKY